MDDLQIKRIQILAEIDRLNKDRCDRCSTPNLSLMECCSANERILELGNELLRLTKPKPLDKNSPLYRQQFTKWLKVAQENGLPYTTYSGRVNRGMSFKEAATTPRGEAKIKDAKKPGKKPKKLTEEQIKTIEANGLDRRQVYWRIRNGWTVEDAISTRPNGLYNGKPVKVTN